MNIRMNGNECNYNRGKVLETLVTTLMTVLGNKRFHLIPYLPAGCSLLRLRLGRLSRVHISIYIIDILIELT